MAVWEVVVLSIVQGLTEFLPISSKTHLLFTQILLGWTDPEQNLFVTVMLHAGSLLAVLTYYIRDWFELFRKRAYEWLPIILASIPAALVGLLLRKQVESLFAAPVIAGGLLVVTGLWLFLAERFGREKHQDIRDVPLWKVMLVGLAQAAALLPGISRSGSTIGAAYLSGFRRPDAVRFSFFLGAPTIFGAILLKLWEQKDRQGELDPVPICIGIVVTYVVSLGAIRVLEILSKKGKLFFFAVYCVVVGIGAFLYFLLGRG